MVCLSVCPSVRLDLSDNFHYIRSKCRSVPKKWVFFRMTHGSLFAECVIGSHMLRKMRKDKVSGGCIPCVVATVRGHVKKLKKALDLTSASAVDLGCCLF